MHAADGAAYDRYHGELETVVPLIQKWILKAPPEAGAGSARPAAACQPRPRPDRPVDRRDPHRPRIRDQERRRHPRPLLRGRPDQGAVRLRRHRRQFRLALHAGHRLRPAPPSVRRGGGGSGRLGPCHRRHGLDHPGDGQGLPRGRASTSSSTRRSARSSSRRAARRASSPAARAWRAPIVVAGVNPSCCSTGWCPRARSADQVEEHFAHWGCESATFRMNVALVKLPNFTVAAEEGRPSDRRHHHGAEHGLYAPRLCRRGARTAGRRSR